MKKRITLSILVLATCYLLPVQAQSPYVAIPDSNFVHYLKTIVPSAFKGDSLNTTSTLVTTTTHSMSMGGSSIANLFGVQYFTSLDTLWCLSTALTTIPALPNSLKNLGVGSSVLTSLPLLPNSLQFLGCDFCALTSLPALPNTLQVLLCNYNNITCFPTFPNSITALGLLGNPYTCLPNYIAAMDSAELATPLCAAGNTNSCAVSSDTCTPLANLILVYASAPHNWNAYPIFSANTSSVKWYWGDGSSSTGFYPSHTYSTTGTYSVCMVAYSACGDSAVYCHNNDTNALFINVLSHYTGIEQVAASSEQVRVYPNPATTSLTLTLSKGEGIADVYMYDVLGNKAPIPNPSQREGNKIIIDISDLSNGIYFLRVETETGKTIKKFIKN